MIVTTTTTLTLGLALRKVTDSPFARTRAATRGPDVVAQIAPQSGAVARPATQFASLRRAGGVTGASGPYPFALASLTAPGIDLLAQAEGRDLAPASLDQPALTEGSWIRPGGAVLESGFAASLGLKPGDAIHLNGHRFTVTGVAVSTAQCFYPVSKPGVIWLTRTRRRAAGRPPATTRIRAEPQAGRTPPRPRTSRSGRSGTRSSTSQSNDVVVSLQTWLDIRAQDFRVITVDQKALLIASSLLALLALASIAVVVGGRMAEQTRRVGLLKAVGATPRMVALPCCWPRTCCWRWPPRRRDRGREAPRPAAHQSRRRPARQPAGAAAVAGRGSQRWSRPRSRWRAAATIVPAVRGARASTISALNDPAHPPRRRAWLIALSAGCRFRCCSRSG